VAGRRTGKRYSTPLVYAKEGAGWIVAGSYGGAPVNPSWYENLRASDMRADFQVAADTYHVKGRLTRGEERERLWKKLARVYPPLESYTTATTREIPLIVLEIAE